MRGEIGGAASWEDARGAKYSPGPQDLQRSIRSVEPRKNPQALESPGVFSERPAMVPALLRLGSAIHRPRFKKPQRVVDIHSRLQSQRVRGSPGTVLGNPVVDRPSSLAGPGHEGLVSVTG